MASTGPPGTIGFGIEPELEQGQQPDWFPIAPYEYFDQLSICGACTIHDVVTVAVPTTCTMQFTRVNSITGLLKPVEELVFNTDTEEPVPLTCISPFQRPSEG